MPKKKKKITNRPFTTYQKYWVSNECKDRAQHVHLLSDCRKMLIPNVRAALTAGLGLMPGWENSCPFSDSCKFTCTDGADPAQLMRKDSAIITAVDKARLSRHWLLINHRDFFISKLKREIPTYKLLADIQYRTLYIQLDQFSEYYLRDELAPLFPEICFYDYFMNSNRIPQQTPANVHEMYSWNERSGQKEIDACKKSGKPIAVVLPREVYVKMFEDQKHKIVCSDDLIIVDCHQSDLHAIPLSRSDQLTIAATAERITRYGVHDTPFLRSWENLNHIMDVKS